MIASLSGMRREEICGLATQDVLLDHDIPHIVLRRNHNRGLKNQTSARLVPIHSALLQAGFADYVAHIRKRQEADLFPDLRPHSASETFGNVLYKKWTLVLVSQLGEGAERKTFHSFRHWVITALRFDAAVSKEVVKDLVGHKQSGETDGWYRDASSLAMLQQAVERIPSQMWAGLS